METAYDPEADAMYIQLKKGKFDHNIKIDTNTILDCDKEGNVLGIEVLFVKERNQELLKERESKYSFYVKQVTEIFK